MDLPEAKNYVGAYHQPAAVLADVATLDTLPAEELAAGYAEVVKTALIAGGALWERVAGGEPVDARIDPGLRAHEARIVAADERDGGPRQLLNLGHTVAHAIETVTSYGASAMARRSGWACSPHCASAGPASCVRRSPSCWRPPGCRRRWRAPARRGRGRDAARQEAPGRRGAVRPRRRAR